MEQRENCEFLRSHSISLFLDNFFLTPYEFEERPRIVPSIKHVCATYDSVVTKATHLKRDQLHLIIAYPALGQSFSGARIKTKL
jgi:hypothetical protein